MERDHLGELIVVESLVEIEFGGLECIQMAHGRV